MNIKKQTPLFFVEVDESHVKIEKQKARDLRSSQWWKQKCAKGVCHYCGKKIPAKELTMDHIVPIIRGGKSTKGNVVACCKACNSEKKYMLPMEWEAYIERLKNTT
jgi:5-methylcytosine-specific restriction endonuclease McrA